MTLYTLVDTYDYQDLSIVEWTVDQILEEINRDRSDEWTNYDKTDWKEGLEHETYFVVVGCSEKKG